METNTGQRNNNGKQPKSKRIFYFDALRALAILSVILFHVFTCTNGMATKEFVSGPKSHG